MGDDKKYYHGTESESGAVGKPAVKYGLPSQIDQLLNFDGYHQESISGQVLEDIPRVTKLPVFEIAEILEISKPHYYRKKAESSLEIKLVDKLSSLLKVFKAGESAFGNSHDFNRWLSIENLHFGNITPKVFLKTEQGRARLQEAIGRIEHGIYG